MVDFDEGPDVFQVNNPDCFNKDFDSGNLIFYKLTERS